MVKERMCNLCGVKYIPHKFDRSSKYCSDKCRKRYRANVELKRKAKLRLEFKKIGLRKNKSNIEYFSSKGIKFLKENPVFLEVLVILQNNNSSKHSDIKSMSKNDLKIHLNKRRIKHLKYISEKWYEDKKE